MFWAAKFEVILSFPKVNVAKLMSIFIMKLALQAGENLSMISVQTSFCEGQHMEESSLISWTLLFNKF